MATFAVFNKGAFCNQPSKNAIRRSRRHIVKGTDICIHAIRMCFQDLLNLLPAHGCVIYRLILRHRPEGLFSQPLNWAEEKEYLARLAQTEDVCELISIGTMRLVKGVNTYEPDKNVHLAMNASRSNEKTCAQLTFGRSSDQIR